MNDFVTMIQPPTPPHASMRFAVNRFEDDIHLAVRSAAPVLLTGSAPATQALAYRIHSSSGWRHGPFLTINCASNDPGLEHALFEALFPNDLTASKTRPILKLAQPGTVLLREVGHLNSPLQLRLAECLGEIAGGIRTPGRAARRVIASTTEPLLPRVDAGSFDDCLYYRLNVIHLMAVIQPR
jgi:DNA-binding NtrC family response regulator